MNEPNQPVRDEAPATASAPRRPRQAGSKWIGRAFILVWLVAVVAVYVVIVQLKIGGERALRLPEDEAIEQNADPTPPAPTREDRPDG